MMGSPSAFCKAYYVRNFREFEEWREKPQPSSAEVPVTGSAQSQRRGDDEILYLHENYTVTVGVFSDEDVVFDDVTDKWRDFCTDTLGFAVPTDFADIDADVQTNIAEKKDTQGDENQP